MAAQKSGKPKGSIASGEFTYEDARKLHERLSDDPASIEALREMDADLARRKKASGRAVLRRTGSDRGRKA